MGGRKEAASRVRGPEISWAGENNKNSVEAKIIQDVRVFHGEKEPSVAFILRVHGSRGKK